MDSLDPPKLLQSLLPSPKARGVLWLFVLLSVGLASLLLWAQAEKLFPLEIAQKLAILILPLTLIVIGSLFALYINNEYFKKLEREITAPVAATQQPDLAKKSPDQEKILDK